MLHITNGDIAKQLIEKAMPAEDVVIAWNDILYEGPVLNHLPLDQISKARAEFLTKCGYGELSEIQNNFIERDNTLKRFSDYDAIVLWFEHDLYDQLQLLQILHWLSTQTIKIPPLSLICINQFEGVSPFFGLGQLNTTQIHSLWDKKEKVTKNQLSSAATYWNLFCDKNPQALLESTAQCHDDFPFLQKAIIRFAEEFPTKENGLNKTEQFILSQIGIGLRDPEIIFSTFSSFEGERYLGMGDTTFYKTINQLIYCKQALISINKDKALSLTETGDQVLAGEANHIALNSIDCWRGGTHLTSDNLWYWNNKKECLER